MLNLLEHASTTLESPRWPLLTSALPSKVPFAMTNIVYLSNNDEIACSVSTLFESTMTSGRLVRQQ